jgi:hypothetical protein
MKKQTNERKIEGDWKRAKQTGKNEAIYPGNLCSLRTNIMTSAIHGDVPPFVI